MTRIKEIKIVFIIEAKWRSELIQFEMVSLVSNKIVKALFKPKTCRIYKLEIYDCSH